MRPTSKQLTVQSLEDRRLMAADLANGELRIDTGNGNDNIEVAIERSFNLAERSTLQLGNAFAAPILSSSLFIDQVVYRNRSDSGLLLEEARFNADDVNSLRIYSNGGHDEVVNNTGIRSYIYGGSGNDVLTGGSGIDYLYGEAGNDTLDGNAGVDRLYGGDGNDLLFGGSGNDYLYGQGGHDELNGESGTDRLYGSSGNDTLRGGSSTDYLYGDSGNDNLYGQSGNDYLYGGSGDDGLFGGLGDDYLSGSTGDDRFLVVLDTPGFWGMTTSDTLSDLNSNDARINFQSGEQTRFNFSGGNWSEFAAGTFTDGEIEKIDEGLADLHHKTGNTSLLKTNNLFNNQLTFERLGDQIAGNFNAAGVNSAGKIILVDATFDTDNNGVFDSVADEDWLMQVIFHEVAHNFDNENSRWNDWLNISGWRSSFFWFWENSSNYTTSGDGEWAYLNGSRFARNYGRFNPYEDFATYFAKVMMDDTGRNYAAGVGGQTSTAKEDFIDAFFAEMA